MINRTVSAAVLLLLCLLGGSLHADDPYDLLIRGAKLIDGTGAPAAVADVAIRDGRIAKIGELEIARAKETIDAAGLILSPGFVDLHNHGDRGILNLRAAENYVRQGATTLVVGNCGSSPTDVVGFMRGVWEGGAGVNVVFLLGHGSVRVAEIGDRNLPPTDEQLKGMQRRVRRAMEAGAVGISTGLRYRPGAYATTGEVVAVAKQIAPYGGFYATHMRDEGVNILEALDEALHIGREAGTPVHVSHHKISSASVWGLTRLTLAKIDQARARGMDVTIDHYPYGAGSSGISLMVPQPAIAGGPAAFRDRIADDAQREEIVKAVELLMKKKLFENGQDASRPEQARVGLMRIQVARLARDQSLEGKYLAEILDQRNTPISLRSGAELIVELVARGGRAIYHTIDDRPGGDVERVMKHPHTSISSDGVVLAKGQGHPHPRSYGTYPRLLHRYVKDRKVLTWEQAIHKMTGLPAQRLGWTDRGLVKPGHWADVVLLDPKKIHDKATFADPHQYAGGIEHVLIRGQAVLKSGEMTGDLPGTPVLSVPVADTPQTKLRRDLLELLQRHSARFGLHAKWQDGEELIAINANDKFFLSGLLEDSKETGHTAMRQLEIRQPAPSRSGELHMRRTPGAEDHVDFASITHVQFDKRVLNIVVAYARLPEEEYGPAVATIQGPVLKRVYGYLLERKTSAQ